MYLLRLLIRTLTALLFAAFGTVAAFAAPGDWTRVSYSVEAQDLDPQPVDLTNAARAPPTASVNVMTTGVAPAQTGNLRVLDGAETSGATYALLRPSIAPNGIEIPSTSAQTQNLRTNMQREGMQFDAGEEAHHIVARNDPRAARSRELLDEAGVDVNSPANGVPLPGTGSAPNPNNKAVHRGDAIHSDDYYSYVEQELVSVPPSQRAAVVRRIADELDRGEINW